MGKYKSTIFFFLKFLFLFVPRDAAVNSPTISNGATHDQKLIFFY